MQYMKGFFIGKGYLRNKLDNTKSNLVSDGDRRILLIGWRADRTRVRSQEVTEEPTEVIIRAMYKGFHYGVRSKQSLKKTPDVTQG